MNGNRSYNPCDPNPPSAPAEPRPRPILGIRTFGRRVGPIEPAVLPPICAAGCRMGDRPCAEDSTCRLHAVKPDPDLPKPPLAAA